MENETARLAKLEAQVAAMKKTLEQLRITGASGNAKEGFKPASQSIEVTAVCNGDGTISITAGTD